MFEMINPPPERVEINNHFPYGDRFLPRSFPFPLSAAWSEGGGAECCGISGRQLFTAGMNEPD